MNQTIFTTRQRAEELIKEAISIWQYNGGGELLEGIEQDPVFSLFMTALAYQANEIDNEIEQLRVEVLDEFARMLVPYDKTHALPATVVVEVQLHEGVSEWNLDHHTSFSLGKFTFLPLLRTRVLNGSVTSVVRLDNRRWKVGLRFREPVRNLFGMTFMVDSDQFQDLKLFANGRALPLVKPWDYADLPLDDYFSIEHMVYNQSSIYSATNTWFDLFAKQNVRLFYIDTYETSSAQQMPTETLDLIFEFTGISDAFHFDRECLSLNATILANVEERVATLSSSSPIVRLSGGDDGPDQSRFLHLIAPPDIQLFHEESLELRKVGADRFSTDRLMKLAGTLVSRFTSDYYAFQTVAPFNEGAFMEQFYASLKRISEGIAQASQTTSPGLYLMLRKKRRSQEANFSLDIHYLMTNGDAVNSVLDAKSQLSASVASYIREVRIKADPMPGHGEIQGADAEEVLARYYMVTNDRIVTPMDIKVFCYKELVTRFGITPDMISSVKVKNVRHTDSVRPAFETRVYIILKDSPYVKRGFEERILMVEWVFQKMIEVRSTNVFPVHVNIEIV